MTEESVSERARERRVIYPRGRSTVATPEHFRIAKLLYEGRPFVMGSTPTTQGATVGKAFDWDGAPAYYQTDLLELAHFVVEGQRTITSASPAGLEANKALADELAGLDRYAYPAPWCWEQCGEMSDDPVIGAAWWDDDETYAPIAGKVIPPPDNIDRSIQREAIALEMQSHADGSASGNAALIVALRNNLPAILTALRAEAAPVEDSPADKSRIEQLEAELAGSYERAAKVAEGCQEADRFVTNEVANRIAKRIRALKDTHHVG